MPRPVPALLSECLERANPRVKHVVEAHVPDVGLVLRRLEQWAGAEGPDGPDNAEVTIVPGSESPAGEMEAGIDGALRLIATPTLLSEFQTAEAQEIELGAENLQRLLHGLVWTPAATLERARLSAFHAHVQRFQGTRTIFSDFELQIYRVSLIRGLRRRTRPDGTVETDPFTETIFTPLLSTPPVARDADILWGGGASDTGWAEFDLGNWNVTVDNSPGLTGPTDSGEANEFIFVVRPIAAIENGHFTWLCDTTNTGATAYPSAGTFAQVSWTRAADDHQWNEDKDPDVVPSHRLYVDGYAVGGSGTAEIVYELDLGRAPRADATGRVVFERGEPSDSAATLEVSDSGSAGPFVAATDGDDVVADLGLAAQQVYHLRVSLTPSPGGMASPVVFAAGVEFRVPVDVSEECVLTFPTRGAGLPWGPAEVGEGGLRVLRTGVRDYADHGTRLATAGARLECDVYLCPDHPLATRADWLRMERVLVSDRTPGETSEAFTLLSYAARAKRTIPEKAETLSGAYVVAATDVTHRRVRMTTALVGAPYAAKRYYMRVRTTTNPALPADYVQPIERSADDPGDLLPLPHDTLVFDNDLPADPLAGDVVEVHSGTYERVALVWQDEDPADISLEIATVYLGLPRERLGLAGLPNGGMPPSVAVRAPGNPTLQAKLLVSNRIDEGADGWTLLAELAELMLTTVTEVAGQLVWVPKFPERTDDDPAEGTGAPPPVVPLAPVAHVFGPDDYYGLQTPVGLEARATVVSCTYGVDRTAAAPDALPAQTVTVVDGDALAALTRPEIESIGSTEVPEGVARWVYNSTDGGLTLATRLAEAVVRAASTGLRVWSWRSAAQLPHLTPGDTVVVMTDQYTDYDPSTRTGLSGWLAVRCVLVGVEDGGRGFRALVPGLSENFVKAMGGNPATQSGAGAAIPVPSDLALVDVKTRTEDGTIVAVKVTHGDAGSPFLSHFEYDVESSPNGTTDWTVPTRVVGTRDGPDRIPAEWDLVFRVTPYTVSTGGTRTAGAAETITIGPNPEANPAYGAAVRTADYVQWSVTLDQETRVVHVWMEEYGADPGTASIELLRPVPDLVIASGDGQTFVRVDLTAATNYGKATAVAYDRNLTRGTTTTLTAQGDAAATTPGVPTAPTFVSKTATSVTNSVVIAGGVPATATVRIYRDGVAVGTVAAAAAGVTQNITDTNLNPSTAYSHEYAAVSAGGIESTTRTAAIVTTTNPGTIAAPVSVSATRTPPFAVDVSWTPGTAGDGTPGGTKYYVETSPDGVGSWVVYDPDGTTSTSASILSGDDYLRIRASKTGWTDGVSAVYGPV